MGRREVAIYAGAAALYSAFIASASTVINGHRVFTLFDDAMISMRYARNLAEHGALTWNHDGAAVEGYTNFLWTLWMAVVHLCRLPELQISLAIIVTGALLLGLAGQRIAALLRLVGASPAAAAFALAATLLAYGLVFWTLRGMEVGLLACLVAVGALALVQLADAQPRRLWIVVACAVAATLTRTDAVVFVGPWLGFCVLAMRGRPRVVAVGVLAGAVVATLAAHTLFRWQYYGDPLPNTYYLKLGGISLSTRLVRGTASVFHLLQTGWFVPVAVGAIAFARPERRLVKLLLAMQVVAAAGYSIYVGGDAWEGFAIPNRYISPALPALFALAALGIDVIAESTACARMLALALVAFAAMQLVTPFSAITIQVAATREHTIDLRIVLAVICAAAMLRRTPPPRWLLAVVALLPVCAGWADWARHGPQSAHTDAERARFGLAIRAATSPDATLATVPAGNIPYFAHLRTIDLLGKSDARIAREAPRTPLFLPGHVKWDYPYSIGQLQPDLVDELFTPMQSWLVDADKRSMATWGYREIVPNIYVRRDTHLVDAALLQRLLSGPPAR